MEPARKTSDPCIKTTTPFGSESASIGQIKARTEKFKHSFYPHSMYEWNKLDPEIRGSSSVAS